MVYGDEEWPCLTAHNHLQGSWCHKAVLSIKWNLGGGT